MTADVELLSEHMLASFKDALTGQRGELDAWLEVNNEADVRLHVEAYARANVAHATAAKDAEIEALRAMLGECYVLAGADTDGDPPERHYRDAVRAVGDLRRDYDEALAEPDYKYRAERLAEALRAVVADMREWGEPAKGAHVERIQRRLDDALRDHDQEVRND